MSTLEQTSSSPATLPPNEMLQEWVRKHLDLVYASACRQVRDPHLAADVTQAVFILLQQKYIRFTPETIVSAWLLRATRFTCLTALHQRRRLQYHEQKAAAMRTEYATALHPETAEWTPIIDAALQQMRTTDRQALAAVYFDGMTHKQFADRIKISEEAAHKRVRRALLRLRKVLERKGPTLSTTAVAGVIAVISKPASAPAHVGKAIVLSLTGHAPAGVSILAKGTVIMIRKMKTKAALMLVLAATAVGFLGTAAYQKAFAQTEQQILSSNPAAPTLPPNNTDFAPPVNLDINDMTSQRDICADFDKGTLFMPDRSAAGKFAMLSWLENKGIDVMYDSSPKTVALLGFDLAAAPQQLQAFDAADAKQVVTSLILTGPGSPEMLSVRTTPAVFAFRTREGGVGLLKITAVTDNTVVQPDGARHRAGPKQVAVQYKLLTPTARNNAVKELINQELLPEIDSQEQQVATAADANSSEETLNALKDLTRTLHAFSETLRGSLSWTTASRAESMANLALTTAPSTDGNMAHVKAALGEIEKTLQPVVEQLQK